MNKAYVYRIYPNTAQQELINKTFGCCRKVWNLMLNDKIEYYKTEGKMFLTTPAMYKSKYPYLKEVDSLALANVQLNLEGAYKKFFREKNAGFPKYKARKNSRRAYTTNNQNGTVRLFDKSIKLPKLGFIKAKIHRLPKDGWQIKAATVSQTSDGKYYASVLFEFEMPACNYTVNMTNAIGLDYASDGLFVDSNGKTGSNHKYYRESHAKLAKAQRRLSRQIESHIIGYSVAGNKRYPIYDKPLSECKNIQKQKLKAAKIHRHISNQRFDNLHKKSSEIANRYDVVCVESLNMKAMSNKGFGNGKATLDNGYGMFLNMLEYKLSERNKHLIKVDKWFPSSQLCNCCGYQNPLLKDIKIRKWECPSCKAQHERDVNAAVNILKEGLRILENAA